MAPFLLLVSATRFIGLAGVIFVTVDSLFYRAFRKSNLLPFESPVDEEQDILAKFDVDTDVEEGGFFFALATAPAHVEDELEDAWLEFASEDIMGEPMTSGGGADMFKEPAETSGVSLKEERRAEDVLAGKDGASEEEEPQKQKQEFQSDDAPKESKSASGQSKSAGEGGSPNTPSSGVTMSEWEVVSDSSDKDKTDDGNGSPREKDDGAKAATKSDVPRRRQKKTNPDAALPFNPTRKIRQLGRVGVTAMTRGIERLSEIMEEGGEESANVAAWQNAFRPEERIRFWTDPDTELKLAKDCNVKVFRMGIDWSRIVPVEPVNGIETAVNWEAVKRYREIIDKVHDYGMRVMLTLFHHSLPIWAAKYGGWRDERTIGYFIDFTRVAVDHFADLVDSWITFNEPHVFSMMTYCAGAWPGGNPTLLETATSFLPGGVFQKAMAAMSKAHLIAYDIITENGKKISKATKIGVSHHVSFMRPYGLADVPLVMLSDWLTRFPFIDNVVGKVDFIGINYYGQEVVSAPGLKLVDKDEYSESGRGVYPDGLYRVLLSFHERYKKYNVPYIITENGVSDSSDFIRRPYITEHLLAIKAAMMKGVPVQGYCFWTLSDNWEWADGYGPKFGLVAVDREHDLARSLRPSYHLFSEIAKTGILKKEQRDQAWEDLQTVAKKGKLRRFCRAVDHGLMYSGGLDIPIELPFVDRDWRFGHYEMEGLQDPLSRFIRFILTGAFLGRKKAPQKSTSPTTPLLPDRGVPHLQLEAEEPAPAMA